MLVIADIVVCVNVHASERVLSISHRATIISICSLHILISLLSIISTKHAIAGAPSMRKVVKPSKKALIRYKAAQ